MGDQRRDDLIDGYRAAFDGWRDLMDHLDEAAWATPTGCPGWDAHDQLAHVVDVERVMLDGRAQRAELTDDPHYVRHDFGRFVEVGVQSRRGVAPAELVEEASETFARRLDQLASLSPSYLDDEVEGPVPGVQMRGSQLLRTRIYDVTTHEWDVRRAVRRGDAPAGTEHLAISFELIVRAWNRVLPSTLDASGVLAVVVDRVEIGRVHLGEGERHGPDADATLAVTVPQLLAIAGGRTDGPALADTDSDGDLDLVRAVLAAGSITP